MTKRSLIRGLFFFSSLLIGMVVFWLLIAKEGWSPIIKSLYEFGWLPFLGFLALSLINFGLYSWRWQLIINAHPEQKVHRPHPRHRPEAQFQHAGPVDARQRRIGCEPLFELRDDGL